MGMKILGISGLEKAAPFKRTNWPGLDDREYRMIQGMDSAAVLVVNGKLVAAAEQERFCGKKHTGDFPIDAIRFCLSHAGVSIFEIDEIAHGFDFAPLRDHYTRDEFSTGIYDKVFSRDVLLSQVRRDLPGYPLANVSHVSNHLAHAASAAYTSGWDECLVVVNQAMGEVESLSAYSFHDGKFKKIHGLGISDSIGLLYSLVTLHLGFEFNSDEYKIMNLAPYGDPSRFRSFFEGGVQLRPDGFIRIPMLHGSCDERENYTATRTWLGQRLLPPRALDEPIQSIHQDVAAAMQECLERAVIHMCEHFGRKTGMRKLALAGSVSLNCTANSKLSRSPVFDDVYVQPLSAGDGAALGAALYRTSLGMEIPNKRFPVPLLGPRYNAREIETVLYRCNGRLQFKRYNSLQETCAAAARLIADGHVIAWSRGRMEYGPCALGNRSILADPSRPEMRERVNTMMKRSEAMVETNGAFRPFASACAMEEVHRWFDIAPGAEFPYKISTVNVRPEMRSLLPAITHVDGSARLQTVTIENNSDFHALLVAIGETTGRQMVLNTSFDVKGQPIVNAPEEAIEAFLNSGIEDLFLENFRVRRNDA
jgi:carbamoyltransferase